MKTLHNVFYIVAHLLVMEFATFFWSVFCCNGNKIDVYSNKCPFFSAATDTSCATPVFFYVLNQIAICFSLAKPLELVTLIM